MQTMMKRLFTLALMLTLSSAAFAQFSFLKQEPEVLPVDQAYLFNFYQQDNKLELTWEMPEPGYYLYQERFTVKVAGDARVGEFVYPAATSHFDDFFGEQPVYFDRVTLALPILEAAENTELTITYQGCLDKVLCYPPTRQKVLLSAVAANDGVIDAPAAPAAAGDATPATEQDSLAALLSDGQLGLVMLTFFGLGILLAFTPCVFPMYPILTGIIAGQGDKLSTGRAFALSMTYVQGMAITYSALGLVVASAGLKYQAALQHPAILIGLAILFLVLSLSMFGVYNLQLPSSWQNRLNQASNSQKGGSFTGVLVMGLISGLVASPCTTAPLSGALIYVAQSGDLMLGGLALYALSMGMGAPLLLLGTSGGKLLPRAGAWMEVIKHVFGFLLIAVSIVMLTRIWTGLVADLLWSLWGLALVLYLLKENRATRQGMAQTARYLVLGALLMGTLGYGGFSVGYALYSDKIAEAGNIATHHGPEFIRVKSLADVAREVAKASAAGKPVMLDLYADWCVACKEFEKLTFPEPEVMQRTGQMVLLQADMTANDDLDVEIQEHYQVLGLPTILFFDRQGNELNRQRVTGFMNAPRFASHLDGVL
ncbi:protein-disulfide reductase DsbD [Ferrimonas sediminicola]|uniref:Thiol:disulfide interchange protein DsbD n=1 Tax=Ferrimonas sediminicola TaxID=2569538 RepID=A0A4U1BL16_9GAMM|nr:protein-disulfide reductase DsbD [Ferrimonas sediminicola]TKB51347.1 protein-disulfide reductase DsbD [Ferrimonas sediminicola]